MPTLLQSLETALPALLPSAERVAAAVTPATQRKRAAVVAHDGYVLLDTYVAARPAIFIGAVAGLLGSIGMLVHRRRRGFEAWGVWAAAAALSGGVAWSTRPPFGSTPTDQAPGSSATPSQAGTPALAAVDAWLDRRAATLDRDEPGWDQRALGRLLGS